MDRPKPVPRLAERALVVKNGSKTRARFSGAMPQPKSRTEMQTQPGAFAGITTMAGGNWPICPVATITCLWLAAEAACSFAEGRAFTSAAAVASPGGAGSGEDSVEPGCCGLESPRSVGGGGQGCPRSGAGAYDSAALE